MLHGKHYMLIALLKGIKIPSVQTRKKQTPWTPRSSIKKKGFPPNLSNFPPNWDPRINFKNIIFIACKWSKICQYYVNSLVISCGTSKWKKKNAYMLNIWFTLYHRNLKFVVKYAFFLPNLYSKKSKFTKKCFFLSLHQRFKS